MLSQSSDQSQNTNHTQCAAVPFSLKMADLERVIRTLFGVDLTPLWEGKELNAEEQKLLTAVGQCVLHLREWIAVSNSLITLEAIQNDVGQVCAMYRHEVLAWAEENSATIRDLLAWIAVMYPSSSSGQQQSNPACVMNSAASARFVPTLSETDALRQARLLRALADPTRLRILSLLSRHEGEVCVFEIVEAFTLEQPTISHHLRILRDADLVDCRKKGLLAYYYIIRRTLERARDVIEGLA